MGQYLSKLSSIARQQQSQQIIKLLNQKRNQGQIRNVREFSEQFQNLMREITSTTLQPITKLFLALENETISAEQFNFMLDRVQDDLVASFAEALSIDTVQKSHEAVIRDVILKNLRAGIAELESKITLYELLNEDSNGFDTALFSTFRESKDIRLNSGSVANKTLFLDPRNDITATTLLDATTELVGERLTLRADAVTYHNISSIEQLFASDTPQSTQIVTSSQTPLTNVIDNTKGTYWIDTLLVREKPENVKVKLQLDFGIVREFNFIEIEPVTVKDLVLEAIHYLDTNNTAVELDSPDLVFDGPVSFRVRKTAARKVILTFRNEQFKHTSFEYKNKNTLYDQALENPPEGIQGHMNLLNDELSEIIPSEEVREVVEANPSTTSIFDGYELTTGIDNIRIGLSTFDNQSIYVSKSIEASSVGQIGLKVLESRPYIITNLPAFTDDTYSEDTITSSGRFLGSIEYWVIKRDFNVDGTLVGSSKFPILPLGVERVYHERLLLTEKSDELIALPDIGHPIFFTNTETDEGNLKVYRNGTELSTSEWSDVTTTADKTPSNGNRMRMSIQVIDQLPGDIFTISYNPITSSTRNIPDTLPIFSSMSGLYIIDLVGDLSAYPTENQLVTIGEANVSNTEISLAIVLRQNTSNVNLSPAVEEYTLMIGKRNISKYDEDT